MFSREPDKHIVDEDRFRQGVKEVDIKLPNWLFESAGDIIDGIVSLDKKDEIKIILLMRHPDTGIEPSEMELKQALTDIPFYALALNSEYLKAKFQRESLEEQRDKELYLLMKKHEQVVKTQWEQDYADGKKTKPGVVSKDKIMTSIYTSRETAELFYLENQIRHQQYREEQLKKMVDLLDRRSFEIKTLLEVEIRLSR